MYNLLFQVLIWDVESQPNRHAVLGATPSRPDLVRNCFCCSVPIIIFLELFIFLQMKIMQRSHSLLQVLTGHKENAEFALATCPKEPYVLSGGG